MSDQSQRPNNSPLDGATQPEPAEPQPSLRETIETAYDEVTIDDESPDAGQSDRERDSYGRFVAKDRREPGEQSEDPAPKKDLGTQDRNEPAPQGSSTRIPEHWSAELKADFSKLPPEGQAILLKRHHEMEADYTRKSQASAGAVQFANALEPVFGDPVIQGSLQQVGFNAVQAIQQWGAFHKQAMSPRVEDRINLLVELTQRMGLDPARLFVQPSQPPPLSDEDMNDPAIQYFANQQARTTSELQAVKSQLQQMLQAEAEQRDSQSLQAARQDIDQFADAKDNNGRPLRPYFNDVVEDIVELFRADPTRDLQATYDKCCWANENVRKQMLENERHQLFGRNSTDRARAALRGNTRGLTSPVAKPNASTGNGSLRSTLEASADEVGF